MCSLLFFFKQKTAYEMRISDWSSDVCSSDLRGAHAHQQGCQHPEDTELADGESRERCTQNAADVCRDRHRGGNCGRETQVGDHLRQPRSEEHTSELQSLMRISYAVFCLKKKINKNRIETNISNISETDTARETAEDEAKTLRT